MVFVNHYVVEVILCILKYFTLLKREYKDLEMSSDPEAENN